ncbi:MAG: hypothetical protein LC126_05020 [Bryobacterales bacterium]|nr:hypothetical protein [Bryobacterales bacterium]
MKSAARYAEGIDAFDADGDGRPDLLAGNSWFRREGGGYAQIVVGGKTARDR